MDIRDLIEKTIERNKNKTFLIDPFSQIELGYGEFHRQVLCLSDYLTEKKVKKGEHIALVLNNSLTFAKLYFACLYKGIVVVPINTILSSSQIEAVIINSGSKTAIINREVYNKINLKRLSDDQVNLWSLTEECGDSILNRTDKLSDIEKNTPLSKRPDIESEDELIMIFTSGTTSDPKAIIHQAYNLFKNAQLFCEYLGISDRNRFLNILPMSYLGGYYNLLLLPFISGGSIVIANAFSAETALNFWEPIVKYQVNTLWFTPTILSILLETDRGTKGIGHCKNNVKLCLAGTAPLSKKVRTDFETKYGVVLLENFALAETLFLTSHSVESIDRNSSGKVLPWAEIKIVDKSNQEVPSGEEGEILAKSPCLMSGYYNAKDKRITKELIAGWFATGDIGYLTAGRELYVTGRKKDIIIRGGINISPAFIEEVLYQHPDVLECAVVGTPHKFLGEAITAVIRKEKGMNFGKIKQELADLCKKELSPIQQPNEFVELPEFPRTASGKIQKAKIRAWLEQRKDGVERRETFIRRTNNAITYKPSTLVENCVEAASIKYNNNVYELKRQGKDIIVLSLGEAFFDLPCYRLDNLPYPDIYHYSHTRGIPELRDQLSKYFYERYDFKFDPAREIMITAGAKAAVYMSLLALIDPGDEVLVHEPAWVSYPEQIKLCHGIPAQVPYDVSLFEFDKFITNRTKAIIINNPNNPKGKVLTLEELSYLYNIAERHNLFIIADEVYSEFVLDKDLFISLGNLDKDKKHSIIVNAISKNFGISGWRLGYAITNQWLINRMLKLNQHLITCAPTVLQHYISKHFYDIITATKPQIVELVEKRKRIGDFMKELGLTFLEGTATFYFFMSIKPSLLSSEEFCTKLLNEFYVSAVPGIGYGKSCDTFIRMSVGAESEERIKKGIKTIHRLIENTSKAEFSMGDKSKQCTTPSLTSF